MTQAEKDAQRYRDLLEKIHLIVNDELNATPYDSPEGTCSGFVYEAQKAKARVLELEKERDGRIKAERLLRRCSKWLRVHQDSFPGESENIWGKVRDSILSDIAAELPDLATPEPKQPRYFAALEDGQGPLWNVFDREKPTDLNRCGYHCATGWDGILPRTQAVAEAFAAALNAAEGGEG